jgi:hypothetical protein
MGAIKMRDSGLNRQAGPHARSVFCVVGARLSLRMNANARKGVYPQMTQMQGENALGYG